MEPLLVVAVMMLSGVVAVFHNRRMGRLSPVLGCMSQHWLAEHRASQPS